MSEYSVQGTGHLVYVLHNGASVAGPFRGVEMAELRIDVLERNAARKQRKCLCCNTAFTSWGVGNRMCELCRRRDNFDGAV